MVTIKLEFESIGGSFSLMGPVLYFQFLVKPTFSSNEPDIEQQFEVRGGLLQTQTKEGLLIVGQLFPVHQPYIIRFKKGDTPTISLFIIMDPISFQRFLEESKNRVFNVIVYATTPISIDYSSNFFDPRQFLNLLPGMQLQVGGKINGVQNQNRFQIDSDSWKRAIEGTKSAYYFTDSIIITNTERDYVKKLYSVIKEAENLLNEGKLGEALGKVRNICDWAGYKPKKEDNRYTTLNNFEFEKNDKDHFKALLDVLWDWTSVGHHAADLSGKNSYTEEQARMGIHLAYAILYYLSHKKMMDTV